MSKNKKTEAEWLALISDFKRSGETQKNWCLKNNMAQNRLSYHLNKNKNIANNKQSKVPQWIVADLPSPKKATLIEIKVGKTSVIVHESFDKTLFSEIIAELVKIC